MREARLHVKYTEDGAKEAILTADVAARVRALSSRQPAPAAGSETKPKAKRTAKGKAKVVTQAEWVQCDGCEKWWMLPADVRAAGLPDSWRCAGASWNPVAAALGCGDAKPTRLKIGKHTAATGEHVEVEFSTGRFVGIVKKIHADKTFSVYFDVDDTAFVVNPGHNRYRTLPPAQ